MEEIVSFLEQNHIPYRVAGEHHHAREGWVQIDCPYCSPSSGRFRLGINVGKFYANCWACGWVNIWKVLQEITGLPASSVPKFSRERRFVLSEGRGGGVGKRVKIPLGVGPLRRAHVDYLRSRGFDPGEIVRLWGVRGIGVAPRLSWRLWIPVHYEGKVVSWTTRSVRSGDAGGSRYISASRSEEAVPLKNLLYGEDYCRNVAIVVEGPMDVWRVGPGAVGLFGIAYTEEQLYKISKYPLRVIALDNEREAQSVARRMARQLRSYPGETVVVCLESAKDWAEADREEVEQLRKFLEV